MGKRFAEVAFTDAVKAMQRRQDSPVGAGTERAAGSAPDRLGPREAAFIAAQESFYMATVSQTGWPYVQHRGGPAGFVRALDAGTIGFADYRGNRQYISTGNLGTDARVALIMVDYANRRRLKLLGRVRLVEADEDAALVAGLHPAGYAAHAERAMLVAVEAFDWNCPQHIPLRMSSAELDARTAALRARVAELEAEVARLRHAAG